MSPAPTTDDLEQALTRLPGVAVATVEVGPRRRGRLQVELAGGHDPADVAAAISEELASRFGIHLDPATIDVGATPAVAGNDVDEPTNGQGRRAAPHEVVVDADAETASGPRARPDHLQESQTALPLTSEPLDTGPAVRAVTSNGMTAAPLDTSHDGGTDHARSLLRPVLRSCRLRTEGLEAVAEVELALGQDAVRCEARSAATRSAGLRALARATLDTVETLADGGCRAEVEHVDVAEDDVNRRVTVVVAFLTLEGPERLVGAALAVGNADEATVRATLDAVNRRLTPLLSAAG